MLAIIISALLGLLGKLPGMLGDYFKTQQQIKQAQIDQTRQLQLKVLDNQGQQSKADSDRAIAVVNAPRNYTRDFAYLIISFPFLCCMINRPEYAQMVFANLAALPGWYTVLFAGMSANMWGIPVPGTMMDGIIQGVSTAVHNNRAYKLAKKGIDPLFYFNAKRDAKGAPLTQQEVDQGNKELELLNRDE